MEASSSQGLPRDAAGVGGGAAGVVGVLVVRVILVVVQKKALLVSNADQLSHYTTRSSWRSLRLAAQQS
ncbi:hypothetical protein D3C71_1934120 [compost metagenome]